MTRRPLTPEQADRNRRRAVTGDLEATYRAMRGPLRRFLTRGAGSVEEAEDLVQETFLRVLQAAPSELTGAYIWTSARHLLAEHWRATLRQPQPAPLELAADLPDLATPERIVLARADLAEIIDGLSPMQHEVLTSIAVGYSQREIARRLGIAPGAVGATAFRARRAWGDGP